MMHGDFTKLSERKLIACLSRLGYDRCNCCGINQDERREVLATGELSVLPPLQDLFAK
jgi:hypothetical protein